MEKNIFNSDVKVSKRGFLNVDSILNYVTEEEIFALAFGYLPVEDERVTSPFRRDNSPGCWFTRSFSLKNKLQFIDFASDNAIPMDCFDAVKAKFGIKDFYQTLEFVHHSLIANKNLKLIDKKIIEARERKASQRFLIFEPRQFNKYDAKFWKPLDISSSQLIADKTFSVSSYTLQTKDGVKTFKVRSGLAYAFTNFKDHRLKLYFPNSEHRFITNCGANDIGGLHLMPYLTDHLIITKSYKDWRILVNAGKTAIWLQNEGMFPEPEVLKEVLSRAKRVSIFFDNDEQGIRASEKLAIYISHIFSGKVQRVWLPEQLLEKKITDISDLYRPDKESALQFIKYNLR